MYALGLHIDGKTLKVALLRREKKSFRVDLLRSFAFEEGSTVKPLYILDSILTGKKCKTVTSLKPSEMLIRELEIKLEKRGAIKNALPFQIESLLPYPLDESIVLPFFSSNKDGSTAVTFFATTQAQLKKHLEEMAAISVDPDCVSCLPSALFRLSSWLFASNESSIFWGHFEERQSVFCYRAQKKLIASTSLPVGRSHFIEALQKDVPEKEKEEIEELAKKIDLSHLDNEKYPHLFQCKEQFRKDLNRLLSFLENKSGAKEGQFAISGDLLSLFHFKSFFAQCIGAELSLLSFPEIQNRCVSELESFAVPIGLALDALSKEGKSVQFRQGAFLPTRVIQRRKKQLSTYLVSCLVLCLLAAGASLFFVKKKEAELTQRLYSYRQFNEEKRADHKGIALVTEIEDWENEIARKKKPFPYLSSAPKVSDVLAWLSTHPKLNFKGGADSDKIEITNMRYTLLKYPKLGEAIEPYQVKVDLEFTASSPNAAEAFHDSLKEGEGWVNAKKEITWKSQQNNYRSSFFLKSARGSE